MARSLLQISHIAKAVTLRLKLHANAGLVGAANRPAIPKIKMSIRSAGNPEAKVHRAVCRTSLEPLQLTRE
jgi:hypothetical protein